MWPLVFPSASHVSLWETLWKRRNSQYDNDLLNSNEGGTLPENVKRETFPGGRGLQDPVPFEYGVPAKYTGAKTSGLAVTIPEAGNKDIKLELTSK
jgi:hypothetical protein